MWVHQYTRNILSMVFTFPKSKGSRSFFTPWEDGVAGITFYLVSAFPHFLCPSISS